MAVIKIFDATDTNFNTAGNIIIEPLYCHEIKNKSLNGWYIDVEISINYKNYIEQDKLCVIQTKSKLNPQAFRIKNIEYTTNKIVFQAQHVMFDAEDYFLLDARPTNQNGLNALNYINGMTDKESPFTMYSNVENISTAYFIRKNLLEAWSIVEERWGGVFDADNWNINFLTSVGNDNGETIYYGKNLESMKIIEDWSGVCTKLYPVGKDGIMLADKYLESTIQYDIPYTRTINFDTKLSEEEQTKENLLLELETNAVNYLQENCVPKVCYEINSNINQNMDIGDIIEVKHPLCNISTEVLEYEYDIILGKIIKIVFGNYSKNAKRKFKAVTNTIETIKEVVNKQQTTIENQTNLINSLNKNGYVYIDENEILLLDTIPKENAKNVWRFGLAGIGFSTNGYEGPFEIAITMDGQINANFITTGSLNVSRIEGLSSRLNSLEFDKDSITATVSDQNSKISKVTQTVDELRSQISEVAEMTTSADGYGSVSLAGINESEPIRVVVRPVGEDIAYLYPRNNLYPSSDLYLKNRKLRFATSEYSIDWELPADLLYYDAENYDELILDYEGQRCEINKKVGYNADGSKYLLEKPTTISYSYPKIPLEAGDYTVTLLGYTGAYLFVRLMTKNMYTTQFATKAEMNSAITQTSQEIDLSVNKKLSNYSTTTQMNAAINLKSDSIISSVSSTYETKTNASNTYATKTQLSTAKSEIKQTTDSISATVSKKVGNDEIISKINQSAETVTINANKINLSGKEINLTSDNVTIKSTNFSVDKNGNMTCNNGTFNGGTIQLNSNSSSYNNAKFKINSSDGTKAFISSRAIDLSGDSSTGIPPQINIYLEDSDPYISLSNFNLASVTQIRSSGIDTPSLTQTSLEENKKNFEKLQNGINIIKNIDIYKYNLKSEDNITKKHIGFVIGDKYRYSKEITSTNNNGVDMYSMISVAYKAIQEQQDKIENLESRIESLERV